MLVLLFSVVLICFAVSLLPVLLPGTLLALLGLPLNGWLGGLLGTTLGLGQGSLVVGAAGQATLTLQGVLVVYIPLLVVLFLLVRAR